MNSKQYEQFCRYFLADQLRIDIEQVRSILEPGPRRPNFPDYDHQIDLYWETEDEVCRHVHIANAKWRGSAKVDQPEMLLLEQVKSDMNAHKAVMITNTGFTSGAEAVAKNKGIALHIVKPEFDCIGLHLQDATTIQHQIQQLAVSHQRPLYSNEIVYKAFDLANIEYAVIRPNPSGPVPFYSPQPGRGYENRAITGLPNKMIGGGQSGGPGQTRGGIPGGFTTRGGGSGFQTK